MMIVMMTQVHIIHCWGLLSVLLIAILGQVHSQDNSCKETPEKWSGEFRKIDYSTIEPTKTIIRVANISYDRTASKLKIMDVEVIGGPSTVSLYDYHTKQQYVVENGVCRKSTTSGEFPTYAVPAKQQFMTPEYIGAQYAGLGVIVNEFASYDNIADVASSSYSPVSGDTCIPVLTTSISGSHTDGSLKTMLFYYTNLTLSVPPNAFSIPSECK